MSKPNQGSYCVFVSEDPWYNLAASIVKDAVLAEDYRFFEESYGDDLLEMMGLHNLNGTDLINLAREKGILYAQQIKSNRGKRPNRKIW